MALFAIVVGIVEVGHALQIRNELAYAADRGTREALLKKGATNDELKTAVLGALMGAKQQDVTVVIAQETVGATVYRTISASYPKTLRIPGLTNAAVTLAVSRRVPTL